MRQRVIAFAVFVGLVCSGAISCTRTQEVLSIGAAATAVAVTTVSITLVVQNQHHTMRGCVFSNADGFKLRTSDATVYALKGDITNLKAGDRVKFHGSKLKKTKGSTGDQVFVVERVTKDYGPCATNVASAAMPTR